MPSSEFRVPSSEHSAVIIPGHESRWHDGGDNQIEQDIEETQHCTARSEAIDDEDGAAARHHSHHTDDPADSQAANVRATRRTKTERQRQQFQRQFIERAAERNMEFVGTFLDGDEAAGRSNSAEERVAENRSSARGDFFGLGRWHNCWDAPGRGVRSERGGRLAG